MSSINKYIIVLAAGFAGACAKPAEACTLVSTMVDSSSDASAALKECIERLPAGGQLDLTPGVYTLRRPLVIARPVAISTAGLKPESPGCADLPSGSCATLLIDPQDWGEPTIMPIHIVGDGVVLSHLIVKGVGGTPKQRGFCGRPERRPLGGGIRVSGSGFILRKSVLRDFACYTALEVVAGARAPVIEQNVVGPNGDHRPGEVWSDGVTIHDSAAAVVRANTFVDNTDVQLILGGCRDCRIEDNRFAHTEPFWRASFAELMLHSWPTTSGNFTGTVVRGNRIDCGPSRRCGFGMMIGASPWYKGRMRGGRIVGNSVRNAMIAINVDALSGSVAFQDNQVLNSGGQYRSDCGTRDWPAVNVAPGSVAQVTGDPSDGVEASINTEGCLLNRQPH